MLQHRFGKLPSMSMRSDIELVLSQVKRKLPFSSGFEVGPVPGTETGRVERYGWATSGSPRS